ncbi:MAG: SPOR domain-containing protein [Gammaproteobacteria bacterium]
MDTQMKQRVVGAAVLVAAAVVLVPLLLDYEELEDEMLEQTPVAAPSGQFVTSVTPLSEGDIQALQQRVGVRAPSVSVPGDSPVFGPSGDAAPNEMERSPAAEPDAGSDAVTDKDTAEAPEINAWSVQLGSFAKAENADRLAAKLRAAGFPGYIERIAEGDKTRFKVKVGPLASREKAVETRRVLAADHQLNGLVKAYRE